MGDEDRKNNDIEMLMLIAENKQQAAEIESITDQLTSAHSLVAHRDAEIERLKKGIDWRNDRLVEYKRERDEARKGTAEMVGRFRRLADKSNPTGTNPVANSVEALCDLIDATSGEGEG